MAYEKINNTEPAVGQIWENISTEDKFLILACDNKHAYCAVLIDDVTPSKALQVRMPIGKLRSWGNRGFQFSHKHKGKLPGLREGWGEYNNRHVHYGAR